MVNFGLTAEIDPVVWAPQLIMVALCNTVDHYIFALLFLSFSSQARLISVGDWMSTMSTIGKISLYADTFSICPHNMVNFALLTAEIRWRVWGTPANFNGFRVLVALLHGTLVVGVSQTSRR